MADRRPYRRRQDTEVTAVRLDLDTEGFTYHKWGGVQRCKAGDWLVDNGGEVYTIDAKVFADTYDRVAPGRYRKQNVVWAEQATEAGTVRTKEGTTDYQPGDYLVFNDPAGEDGYAMTAERFEELYEPAQGAT